LTSRSKLQASRLVQGNTHACACLARCSDEPLEPQEVMLCFRLWKKVSRRGKQTARLFGCWELRLCTYLLTTRMILGRDLVAWGKGCYCCSSSTVMDAGRYLAIRPPFLFLSVWHAVGCGCRRPRRAGEVCRSAWSRSDWPRARERPRAWAITWKKG
jgi:hypothetical protein